MSFPATSQALSAAFTFGIVFNSASAALFLSIQGQGTKVFRDGLRLVLITFLASSALWAQIDFIATLINPSGPLGCQVAVTFASSFDQIARLALEQYLLWAINSGVKPSPDTFIPQALLAIRLLVGGIFVAFQRTQMLPICQPSNNMVAIGIAVAATDAVIIAIFVLRAFMTGLVQDFREKRPGHQRAKAVLMLIVGLALWTGASVPLFLGIPTIDIIWRTALPAGALSILLALVAVFLGPLVLTRARASGLPQNATSPPDDFQSRSTQARDISSSESEYPPNRYEDLKSGVTTSITATRAFDDGNGAAGAGFVGAAVGGMGWQARRSSDETTQAGYQRPRANILASGVTVGKLAISHPILQQVDENSPFNKIATVDLATAARNERERRNLAALQEPTALIAQRAAPRPPAITTEEALKRSQSKMKRKEIVRTSQDTMEPRQSDDSNRLLPTATVTSSQTSPGIDSLRRRSPRQSPQELSVTAQDNRASPRESPLAAEGQPKTPEHKPLAPRRSMDSLSSQQTAVPSISPSQTSSASPPTAKRSNSPPRPELPSTWPKQTSVRDTIRPSRMQALATQNVPTLPSQQAQQDNDTSLAISQPPIQRRGTIGLPSNPRAHGMKIAGQDGGSQPTVLFMNQIQYNNPTAVQSIIDGATGQVLVKTNAETNNLPDVAKARDSVVHRPRPIPRQQDSDRQLFPSEQSPRGHVRNRSGGSITSRKSILRSTPGSPTQLPALPPLPKSAGQPLRPQPNDTRSMTFNEKMELFFPGAPKSAGPTTNGFRGSIPDLPPLPAVYATEKNKTINEGSDVEVAQRTISKRSIASSQRTSLRTQSIFEIDEEQTRMPDIRNTSKFSVDTYTTVDRIGADDVHDSWIPIMPERPRSERSYEGSRRRSSPVIPITATRMSEVSDARTRDEEATTNWGSIHSPIAAVNIKQARQIPVSTYIQNSDSGNDPRNLSIMDQNDGKEVMTIMLDASIEHDRSLATASWFDERQQPDNSNCLDSHWHHRLGEECTTFSARKERVVSRRMPPPTPLLLNSTTKNSIIVAAEPSPLESPQQAYEIIQQQLKHLEEMDRDPMQDESERLRLLESLEQEMGQQESQWHEMQNGFSRDSVSTVETRSSRQSDAERATSGTQSRHSHSSSIAADRRASRRARLQSSVKPARDSAADTIFTGAESRRQSRWQQKLADAEHDFAETADLMAKPFLNFLSVSVPNGQLGSPTPPDTDESDKEELDFNSRAKAVLARKNAPCAKLWRPTAPEALTSIDNLLWAAPARIRVPVAPEDLPGHSVRPSSRKIADSLEIESNRLWNRRNSFAAKPHSVTIGLWRGAPIPVPVQQVNVRPVTQRPPRRNKRVTLLPDIIESPKELPDKRGTLGIFQFPWGEKSDTATVQMRPNMFMAMPGTMSSGGPAIQAVLEARAKQLEAEEYSASFFDDYDEDEDMVSSSDDDYDYEQEEEEVEDALPEDDEDGSDYSQERSDDDDEDFDESTLWEIASLLKSDQVPSKNSLLPQPHRESEPSVEMFFFESLAFEGDPDEQTFDQDGSLDNRHNSGSTAFDVDEFPAPPLAATLWTESSDEVGVSRVAGLPEVDEQTWGRYQPTMDALPRNRPKIEPAIIQSTELWLSPNSPVKAPASLLWAPPAVAPNLNLKSASSPPETLWTAMATVVTKEPLGIYSPNHVRSDYRTTTAEPAAREISRKPRLVEGHIAELATPLSLWANPPRLADEPVWILAASMPQVVEDINIEATISGTPLTVEVVEAVSSQLATSQLLWAAPSRHVEEEISGLFKVSSGRHEYRTTSATPAAWALVRKPRHIGEAVPEISPSAPLWDQVQPARTGRADVFWVASAPALRDCHSKTTTRSLWTAPTVVTHNEPTGLYQNGQPRTSFRTTSAEPAALETPRRPRLSQDPVHPLVSSALWKRKSAVSYEYDWISIASIGPQSPSYASSSGRSTPTSESASLKTNSTKASSFATSISNAIPKDSFPGPKEPTWWEEPKQPTLSELPEHEEAAFGTSTDAKITMLAVISDENDSLKTRLPRRIEASSADWDTELLFAVVAGQTRQHQQPKAVKAAATQAQWNDALSQAIKEGRAPRQEVTTADWDLALEEALSAGSHVVVPDQIQEVQELALRGHHLPTTSLWLQAPKETDPQGSLWSRTAPTIQKFNLPTSIESKMDDLETQRLRRKRVQALLPKSRRAEICWQIAAIEAGADPATVGLVNFSGHSLWTREGACHSGSNCIRSHGRDWLRL
ncbi:hypothetical protein ACHAQH_000801 [Verticillium albo-atrum]